MEPQVNESRINIENIEHIKSVKNTGMIATAIVLMLIGAAAMAYGFAQQGTSTFNTVSLIVGIAILILGVILVATKSKKIVYKATGSAAKIRAYYFNRSDLEHMRTLLDHSGFSLAKPIELSSNGNIKMDVIVSNDKHFIAAQIFEYIPFEYQAATKAHVYNDVQAGDFIAYLERCPKVN
ncbi:MAG: hypothetical protein LBH92_07695 [Bacteroidales bacterium]|jgi:hypothetical protein|nr:hypothetical protein [Bacteroidales bacterium]